jgi:hypothetical protein
VLFSHFKPICGTHFIDQIEVVVQIGVNATETIKKGTTSTEFALPTTLEIFTLGALSYLTTRISTSKPAWSSTPKTLDLAQD